MNTIAVMAPPPAPGGMAGGGAERIFDTLREAVLDHRLPPGMQLKEQTLADHFGVNRAVVRAVLARLEACRLVEHAPNRGVFVARPSVAEARDIFAARRVIEAAIVDAFVAAQTPAAVAALRRLVDREQAAYRAGRVRAGLRLAVEFHRQLARHAGNTVLEAFVEELVARTPLVMLAHRAAQAPCCALDEHSAIIDAMAAGDAARARALMGAHLAHLESRLGTSAESAAGAAEGNGSARDLAALLGAAPAFSPRRAAGSGAARGG